YIGHGLHLEQKFIPRAFGRIPGTAFLGAQDREIDPRLVEQFYKGLGDFLGPIVKTSGTTDPKQDFRLFSLGKERGHGGYVDMIWHCYISIKVPGTSSGGPSG